VADTLRDIFFVINDEHALSDENEIWVRNAQHGQSPADQLFAN